MSTVADLDDEMEAMLREIEGMGMTPDAAAPTAAAAPEPEPAAEPPIETTDEAMAALADMLKDDIEDISDTPTASDIPDAQDIAEMEAAVAAIEEEAAETKPAAKKGTTAADLAKKRLKDEGFIVPEKSAAKVADPDAKVKDGEGAPTPTDPENVVKAPKPAPRVSAASTTDDVLDPEQVKIDIAINPTDLDTELIQHPGLQLHYALKTAGARRAYERLKSGVEILEARLDSSYRDKLFDGTKKPTEAAIRNALVADPQYASAQAKLIDAQHLWKMCEAVESSFHSRKDILLEVARDRRKEKEGAMRVLDDTELRERVLAGMKK